MRYIRRAGGFAAAAALFVASGTGPVLASGPNRADPPNRTRAAALAAVRIGGRYFSIPLHARGRSISLTRRSPAAARASTSPLRTLTVTGTNLAGKPDTGDLVFVDNVDNSGAPGTGLVSFRHGTATFHVADGTYWAGGMFAQFSRKGRIVAARLDVLPQFTVSANTTVDLAASAATSKVTMIRGPAGRAAPVHGLGQHHGGPRGLSRD
jgi:hypothetical protein